MDFSTLTSRTCECCGKTGVNLKRCSRCKHVHYCDKKCQVAHFMEHKTLCKNIASSNAKMWSEGQKSEQATGAQGTDELISSIARQTERLVMSGVASGDNQKDIARQIADAIKDEYLGKASDLGMAGNVEVNKEDDHPATVHSVQRITSLANNEGGKYGTNQGSSPSSTLLTHSRHDSGRAISETHGISALRNSEGELVALTMLDPEEAAWIGPKTSFEELKSPNFHTLAATLGLSMPGNIETEVLDYHAWCLDENGNICDYDDKLLCSDSKFGSQTIVRKPFLREVQEQVESWCEKNSVPIVITGEVMGCDIEFEVAKVPLGHCYQRAKLLHLLEPKTYPTIVFGSLGFVHQDGRTFWEYG